MNGRVFCRYTDNTSLLSAIDNVKYPGGEFTNILSTLKIILQVFNPVLDVGNRGDVQNIGILISDGAPETADLLLGVASDLVQAVGTGVFVVCDEPSCRDHYAKVISSPPQKVRYCIHCTTLIHNVRPAGHIRPATSLHVARGVQQEKW